MARTYTLHDHVLQPGERLAGFQVAVTTAMAGADAALFDALPDLRLVLSNGAGADRLDAVAAKARGIELVPTPDAVTEDTADFAIGLLYALSRRIAEADRFVRSGRWANERMSPSRRVSSRRLGILGLGRIGFEVARRAMALGLSVAYCGPRRKPVDLAYYPDPVELARAVDTLVLTCPATMATLRIIDTRVLNALGPDGQLINIARGSVVDEPALIAALEGGAIAGAALDVFDGEPTPDPRLFALENVVLTPHVAAVTAETRMAMATQLRDAADRFFASV